jgi:hypothetical protein
MRSTVMSISAWKRPPNLATLLRTNRKLRLARELRPGRRRLRTLWTVLLQLRFQVGPGYSSVAVLFNGVKPSIEFGLLPLTQWQVLLLETVPKLPNQIEALRWGELNNFVNRRYRHPVRVTRKEKEMAMTVQLTSNHSLPLWD